MIIIIIVYNIPILTLTEGQFIYKNQWLIVYVDNKILLHLKFKQNLLCPHNNYINIVLTTLKYKWIIDFLILLGIYWHWI